jgi:glycine cleavage system aminomethyltransferase T
MTMMENIDSKGVARYPVGQWPIVDPDTGDILVDSLGRRSYATSTSYGPSLGKNIILGYLPLEHAKVDTILAIEYFNERYLIKVEAVGCVPLYDPKNVKPKS